MSALEIFLTFPSCTLASHLQEPVQEAELCKFQQALQQQSAHKIRPAMLHQRLPQVTDLDRQPDPGRAKRACCPHLPRSLRSRRTRRISAKIAAMRQAAARLIWLKKIHLDLQMVSSSRSWL